MAGDLENRIQDLCEALAQSNQKLQGKIEDLEQVTDVLRRSEQRFKTIFDNASDGILIRDLDTGYFIQANKVICEMLGYSRAELMTMGPADLDPEENPGKVFRRAEEIKSQGPKVFELVFKTKDGRMIAVENSSRYIEYEGRECIISFCRDESARQEAERALAASEARFRTIFDNAADAILIRDVETGRFVEVNQVACDLLGYSRQEFMEMTPSEIDAPEYREQTDARAEQILESGSMVFELEHVARDGRVIPIEMSSRAIDYEGRPSIISIARDMTRRKEAEAQVRQIWDILGDYASQLQMLADPSDAVGLAAETLKRMIRSREGIK